MKTLHLICNAHIDPVWQWTFDEGISATISTFKSAADLCDEFDYIFCHGEALLYEAIEKNAPELFERIKAHVKTGKWVITSGWYLQPDCLMPSGETFIRHIAVGKKYFKEKFGVEPEIATNYDSFGHSVGLVQILAENGYKGYIATRPYNSQRKYPSEFFTWRSPDGSEIIFASGADSYNSRMGHAVEKIREIADGCEDVSFVLWGVGNHGGGPSRKDLRDIKELDIPDVKLIHSTPEALFADDIRVTGPVEESIVTCMPGCYSSMAKVKSGYRRCENTFYAAEKMLAAAAIAGMKVDLSALMEAEKRMLLSTFHDILPGTCTEEGEREALTVISSAEKAARDYRTEAFLYLTMNEGCAGEGEYPVYVFNYMPKSIVTPVEVEFMLADQNWSDTTHYKPTVYDAKGNPVPTQQIKENSTLNLDWRKKVVFEAELAPMSVTRFVIKTEPVAATSRSEKATRPELELKNTLIPSGAELIMYDDTADPWAMSDRELVELGSNPTPFNRRADLPEARVIEDGEIYRSTECEFSHSRTDGVIEYKVYKNQDFLDMKITVEFSDKDKAVRVRIPVPEDMKGGCAVGDGPYVWEKKPDCEASFQKWLGVSSGEEIFAVINDGVYGGNVKDGYIYLTLLRGAGYCFHPILDRPLYPTDRYMPRIDSGRYTFNLRIIRGDILRVTEEAELFNCRPYAVNVFPIGKENSQDAPKLSISGEVTLGAFKPTEDGGAIIRLYNPTDCDKECALTIGNSSLKATVGRRKIATVIYRDGELELVRGGTPV